MRPLREIQKNNTHPFRLENRRATNYHIAAPAMQTLPLSQTDLSHICIAQRSLPNTERLAYTLSCPVRFCREVLCADMRILALVCIHLFTRKRVPPNSLVAIEIFDSERSFPWASDKLVRGSAVCRSAFGINCPSLDANVWIVGSSRVHKLIYEVRVAVTRRNRKGRNEFLRIIWGFQSTRFFISEKRTERQVHDEKVVEQSEAYCLIQNCRYHCKILSM